MKVDGIFFRQILQIRSEGYIDLNTERSTAGGASKEVSLDPLSVTSLSVPIMLYGDSNDEVEDRLERPFILISEKSMSHPGGGMKDGGGFEDVDASNSSCSSEGDDEMSLNPGFRHLLL